MGLVITDIFIDLGRYNRLLTAFKSIKIVYLFVLLKKRNDILNIILHTFQGSFKAISNTIIITFILIYLYGLIGVDFLRGVYYTCEFDVSLKMDMKLIHTKDDCLTNGG